MRENSACWQIGRNRDTRIGLVAKIADTDVVSGSVMAN
jgi:hypothetical protein